jgi:cell division protein FtsQ
MSPAMMAARHFSFPVVAGINPRDPLSVRTPRMRLYQRFIADLDSGGEKISSNLSEIDLSDLEDVRATIPAGSSDMVLHFGDEKFLTRYGTYTSHLAEWQQYPRLASVDLRYDTQVVLKMADGRAADAASEAASADPPAAAPAVRTPTPPATAVKKHPAPAPTPAAAHKHAAKVAG